VLLVALTSRDSSEVSRDAALVHRLLHQDVNAFEQLYDRHSRIVYSLVLRILQQTQTAEEVVQDVFLQVWRNAAQYQESRGPFVPWLLTMARNRALDTLRLKSERQQRRAERVRSLMAQLSAPQQKAIEMAYFEGLSHTEIAAALKEPLGTVKSWIRNGLLRLKEGLSAVS
jgi:RNA polymerase sigma-70 factor, ECF subfamily